MRVEGFEWQNMAFEARPPACCSLVISWWGQASYNSLLVPLSASLAFSPATAVFSVHCSAKHFERYLQDMGFLELTLVNGNTTFDLKDVSRTMLGKLSVSISNLTEGHPVHGSYPIFANGHRLIGSITFGITVVFYNRTADGDDGQSVGKLNRCRTDNRCGNAKPHIVSSFERNEELASADNTLPLYPPTPFVGPRCQSMRRDVNVNPYSSLNTERRSGSTLLDQEDKLVKHSIEGHKSSRSEQVVEKIVKRLARSKSSSSSDAKIAVLTEREVDSPPFQQDNGKSGAHSCSANLYLDPSFCELDELEVEKADSLCGSDDSNLSCVISKSARLIKSLACESSGQDSVKSANLYGKQTALKDSNRLKDLGKKGMTMSLRPEKEHDLPTKPRKAPLKVEKLDDYASVLERYDKDVKDAKEKQLSDLSTSERIRSLRDIPNNSASNAFEGFEERKQSSNLTTSERMKNLRDISKESAIDASEGFEESKPQSRLWVPQAMQLCSNEAKRGGLPDSLVPSPVPGFTLDCTKNLPGNAAHTAKTNVWRGRNEEKVAEEVIQPKGIPSFERNIPVPDRSMSSGAHPPLMPKVDFGFDPGGERHSAISSLTQTKGTNLTYKLNEDRADPSNSCNLEGESGFSFQPKANIEIDSGKKKLYNSCSSPEAVIDGIKQLIKRAEACRDTLKNPEFSKIRSMTSPPIPSVESIHISRSHSSHLCGLYSTSDDLLANILAANDRGHDGEQPPSKVLKHIEHLDLADDIDDASVVVKTAFLEGLYDLDNDKTLNVSSNVAVEPAPSEANFKAIQSKIDTSGVEGYWHDGYLKPRECGLKNPIHWPDDTLNATKYNDMPVFYDRVPAQGVDVPRAKHDQPFTLRITIGKLVLCGPMVRDLADYRTFKGAVHSLKTIMHPTCICSLTISFPALIPPYSSKQRICISPVSFGTREAVFDHQSQLSWNILPGHNLQDWQSRDLRVTVLLTWQRFDNLECAGCISLEKVVNSMPGIYRTSLALALTSHPGHKRSRSNSPSRRRRGLKQGEKQRLEPGALKQPAGSRRNCLENLERVTSVQKNAVARVDVMLQLSHDTSLSANKHERFEETYNTRTSRPSSGNKMKSLNPRRVLTNSDPVLSNSQDWWLHISLHDVVDSLENVLKSPQYSSTMQVRAPHLLLVVKSGSELSVQIPFPTKLGLRNQSLGNSTSAVLRAPARLLKTRKAVMFIEVWHDGGVVSNVNSPKPIGPLVGLIKVPLTVVPGNIMSPTDDCRRISAKGGELVAEGLHQVFDPLKCTAVGTVMVVVTLGFGHQMHWLWKSNRAATLIQRRVREFLTKELGRNKSIEITRFWDTIDPSLA